MDKAKASVSKILGKSGQHDTTIHETVAPAVQHETVQQQQHERSTQAIDREVHQDHYHTTEQPIHHSEVLPEQHHHRQVDVEHRSFEHDSPDVVKRKLAEQQAQYRDHSQRVEGESTRSAEPTVTGEHKHHHVHETIQPVVQKQTVEPHVVHTTVPVHEVHHNEAQHHSASALPPVSMEEFKNKGGALGGREEKRDFFPGEPRSFGSGAAGAGASGLASGRRGSNSSSSSDEERRRATGRGPKVRKDRGVAGATTAGGVTGAGYDSSRTGTDGALGRDTGYGNTSSKHTTNPSDGYNPATGSSNTSAPSGQKPSLMDKLNPTKDATGDGQAGFMK